MYALTEKGELPIAVAQRKYEIAYVLIEEGMTSTSTLKNIYVTTSGSSVTHQTAWDFLASRRQDALEYIIDSGRRYAHWKPYVTRGKIAQEIRDRILKETH